MNDSIIPQGYLLFSDAISRLDEGMWGGIPRPRPVHEAKKNFGDNLSVEFGPWRQQAAQHLRAATCKGELAVYVASKSQKPVLVPPKILRRLITWRGSPSNRAIRSTMRIAGGDEKLFRLLAEGLLVVRRRDFDAWYRSERAKGKWPSQRSRLKKAIGRPTKRTEAIRSAVLAHMSSGEWSAKDGIATLRRLLEASGHTNVPSPDTLGRLIDELHRETGEVGLRRTPRVRRNRA